MMKKMMNLSKTTKEKLDAIAQEYLGAIPADKHCTTWQQLQDKMVADIVDVLEEEPIVVREPILGDLYYIQNGYVGDSRLWWRDDSKGYTIRFAEAGRYSKKDALEIINNRPNEDCAWLCSYVDNAIETHVLSIGDGLNIEFRLTGKKK